MNTSTVLTIISYGSIGLLLLGFTIKYYSAKRKKSKSNTIRFSIRKKYPYMVYNRTPSVNQRIVRYEIETENPLHPSFEDDLVALVEKYTAKK